MDGKYPLGPIMLHENVTSSVLQLLLFPLGAEQCQALPGVGRVGVCSAVWC